MPLAAMRELTAEILTVGTCAREIGVSTERVRQFIREGRLEAVRGPLNYRLVRREALEKFMRERKQRNRAGAQD